MGTALARLDAPATAVVATPQRLGLLRPVAVPSEVLQAQEELRDMVAEALTDGRDYGVIPGTEKKDKKGRDISKKVLLKPGAERLLAAFGLAPSYKVVEQEVDHDRVVTWSKRKKVYNNRTPTDKSFEWAEETGTSLGLYRYVIACEITHRDSGAFVASALGTCSTLESKYIDRPRDMENTVVKMASKRALVAVTLNGLGLSDQFTQDVEEDPTIMKGNVQRADDKWNQPRPEEPQQEPEPVTEPALTMAVALEMPLPGKPEAWGKNGGKPLRDVPAKVLAKVIEWVEGDPERAEKFVRLHDAAQMVWNWREAEAKAMESARAVGAADPAPTLTPEQQAQSEAIKAEAAAAPLTGAVEDDGLPF